MIIESATEPNGCRPSNKDIAVDGLVYCKMNTYSVVVEMVLFLVAAVASDALQLSKSSQPSETSTSIISFNERKILLSRRSVISTTASIIASSSILDHPSIANAAAKNWKQWTCDELTPNLCDDLEVESGSIILRSIPVKYWRYRRKNQDAENTDTYPIICIHGGPGYPHNYMLPLKQLACQGNREVIFYDQAGYVLCFQ